MAFFPSDNGDIAVNSSGAGPADQGDLYVVGQNRIQRFAAEDNGTPADPYDDTYSFVAAWGADVDSTPSGGSDYEICTVESECKPGVAAGGNGTSAGNGALNNPEGIAVDEDTGNVYVTDQKNNRINVYSGDGAFLRSFGWDVVESGSGDTGTSHEVCIAANGDVCQAGAAGSGVGQIGGDHDGGQGRGIAVSASDGSPATGTVFLADRVNGRVNTYALQGSTPSSFGSTVEFSSSSPGWVAVDSRGIVYASDSKNGHEIERYDTQNANGGGVGFLAPISAPPLLSPPVNGTTGLEVDPDSDGAGLEEDVLYVLRNYSDGGMTSSAVQQFGPLNDPGLMLAPTSSDDLHGSVVQFTFTGGFGLDSSSGRPLVATPSSQAPKFGAKQAGTYMLDTAGGTPSASLDSVSNVTATSATVDGSVNPNGGPPVSYQLEYSLNGSDWIVDPGTKVVLGIQTTPQPVSAVLDPPGTGLLPGTEYHVRISAAKAFNPPVVSSATTFTTLSSSPQVETTGAPVRAATTAQLTGRVNPRGSATTYRFEYGTQGPCDANPCISTTDRSAGSGQLIRLVSEEITGLQSDTTYHYRLVADNGNPGSPVAGESTTVTTRGSDAPLSHGTYPGPPGSDRAYEQVSARDTSGNPVHVGFAFSDDGNRAAYSVLGGTPDSNLGGPGNMFFAQRPIGDHPAGAWRASSINPPRSEFSSSFWSSRTASDDLSTFAVQNNLDGPDAPLFQLTAAGTSTTLHRADAASVGHDTPAEAQAFAMSNDGSRVVWYLNGSHDPAHPAPPKIQLYDVSSGTPELISLLPDGSVPPCGVNTPVQQGPPLRATRWLSADGSLAFFESSCAGGLHVRDLEADETKRIGGDLIKATADAAFYLEDGNVHRYDLGDETSQCVTCVVPALDADVFVPSGGGGATTTSIAVAEDGSRVYFKSPNVLMPGTAPDAIYRIDVDSGELAFVANIGASNVGDDGAQFAQAIAPDGSTIVFRSSDPWLNPLGGSDNGASFQYYRYDDRDRSITCISCPPDGSAPSAQVSSSLVFPVQTGPNTTALAADGTVVAFATPTPLVSADQNTPEPGVDPRAGTDLYEWRDGRLLLVTDGLTEWPVGAVPQLQGISPSGRDLFFTASTQLTADALDGFTRLYDARIGGGIDFPDPPPPCALEVCQGTPQGAPKDASPATSDVSGPGNRAEPLPARRKCRRGQRRVRRGGGSAA